MKSKFYRVTCKCGHCGRRYFIRIDFPVNADTAKEAAEIARNIPRVKHDHKFAILDCREIDYEEYCILQKINSRDPYLKVKNRQEQRLIADLSLRMEVEPKYLIKEKRNKRNNVEYRMRKQQLAYDDYDEEWEVNYNEVLVY